MGNDEIVVQCCCGERLGRVLAKLGVMALFVGLVSSAITIQRWPKPPPLLYEEESEDAMRQWDSTLCDNSATSHLQSSTTTLDGSPSNCARCSGEIGERAAQ